MQLEHMFIQDRSRQYKSTVICQSSVRANRGSWVSPEETDNGKHWFINGNNGNYPLLGLSTHWQLGLTLVITAAEWSCPQKATPPLDHDGDEDDDDLSMEITMVTVIRAQKDMGGSSTDLCFTFWHRGTLAPLHNGSCLHCLWRGTNTINGHLLTWTITSTHTLIRDTIFGTDFNNGMIRTTGATEIYCIGLLSAIYCVNTRGAK